MREIPIPAHEEERAKKRRTLRRTVRFLGVLTVASAGLAIACLLGVFVAAIVAEFNRGAATLCYYLAAGFGGGAVLFALLAVLFGKLSARLDLRLTDYCERCDGEDSFYVGEGTLATFCEDRLRLHGEEGDREIFIPYSEIRVFSVCTRILPREKGKWSVVLEIPRRYIEKEWAVSKDDPPALVQTDAKDRLFHTLEKYGIEALGEHMPSDMPSGKKFKPQKKCYLPDRKKRRRALITGGLGLALIAAGVPIAILFNMTAGIVLGVFGAFFLARSSISFVRARGMLAAYGEGIYWRETERRESVFLKWEEVERIQRGEHKGFPILTVHCPYGDYHFPDVGDMWAFLSEHYGEKCDA